MQYINHDYVVWTEGDGKDIKCFIRFYGQKAWDKTEITCDMFKLYVGEFRKPMERQRKEKRRHIDGKCIEYYIHAGKLFDTLDIEEQYAIKEYLTAAFQICTKVQRERFRLHFIFGLSYVEIARMQRVTINSVENSILSAIKKFECLAIDFKKNL